MIIIVGVFVVIPDWRRPTGKRIKEDLAPLQDLNKDSVIIIIVFVVIVAAVIPLLEIPLLGIEDSSVQWAAFQHLAALSVAR
jgi:hypothetical protein